VALLDQRSVLALGESEPYVGVIGKQSRLPLTRRITMTKVKAAEIVLRQNGNVPMTANDIWAEIKKQKLVSISSTAYTPEATLRTDMNRYSDNQSVSKKNAKGLVIFNVIGGGKSAKFRLTNARMGVASPPKVDLIMVDPPYAKPLSVWRRIQNWFMN